MRRRCGRAATGWAERACAQHPGRPGRGKGRSRACRGPRRGRTLPMPAKEAFVDAGGREVRVSSPDRVIFPATERTPELTKLQIAEYYVAVGDGIMRATARRPTTLERWPKGVLPGIRLSTRAEHGGDAFYQKRIPK